MNYPSTIEIKVYHFTGLLAVEPFELGADLDHDGDVDGSDLAILIGEIEMMRLADFALNFGKTRGP